MTAAEAREATKQGTEDELNAAYSKVISNVSYWSAHGRNFTYQMQWPEGLAARLRAQGYSVNRFTNKVSW